jgi:hypothetical protein
LLVAVEFAGGIGRTLYHNLKTFTMEELAASIWAKGSLMFILWALSVSLGSIAAGIGAFIHVKTKPIFPWLTSGRDGHGVESGL